MYLLMIFRKTYGLVTFISRYLKKRNQKSGLPPGSLVHVGKKRSDSVQITLFNYDKDFFEEKKIDQIENCLKYRDSETITWINIDSVSNPQLIEKIGNYFQIHPLVLEDVMNTGQRPKMEVFDNYLYFVFKMLHFDNKTKEIQTEQISIILTKTLVISFQECPGDIFNNIRDRIRNNRGYIRKMGADYLAYTLFDAIVDHYFIIMESLGEIIEETEEMIVDKPIPTTLKYIHQLKGEIIYLRKSIWPMRELVNGLFREDTELISNGTIIYFKDVYDHIIQVIDTIESYRDVISGMFDIYMSSVSNKTNEVMKVLTIFASIFIPLTFVAGIYGMNFNSSIEPVRELT